MDYFKERLKTEFSELNEKAGKLETFLNTNLIDKIENNQKHLLYIQLASMKTYLQCLNSRLQLLD